MSNRWHILRDDASVTLCRHLPPRLDFAVQTTLPKGRGVRLAHQIRQDVWRALATLRGYSPVVVLEAAADGWQVTVGGRVARMPVPERVLEQARAVLENPSNRARWMRSAGGAA